MLRTRGLNDLRQVVDSSSVIECTNAVLVMELRNAEERVKRKVEDTKDTPPLQLSGVSSASCLPQAPPIIRKNGTNRVENRHALSADQASQVSTEQLKDTPSTGVSHRPRAIPSYDPTRELQFNGKPLLNELPIHTKSSTSFRSTAQAVKSVAANNALTAQNGSRKKHTAATPSQTVLHSRKKPLHSSLSNRDAVRSYLVSHGLLSEGTSRPPENAGHNGVPVGSTLPQTSHSTGPRAVQMPESLRSNHQTYNSYTNGATQPPLRNPGNQTSSAHAVGRPYQPLPGSTFPMSAGSTQYPSDFQQARGYREYPPQYDSRPTQPPVPSFDPFPEPRPFAIPEPFRSQPEPPTENTQGYETHCKFPPSWDSGSWQSQGNGWTSHSGQFPPPDPHHASGYSMGADPGHLYQHNAMPSQSHTYGHSNNPPYPAFGGSPPNLYRTHDPAPPVAQSPASGGLGLTAAHLQNLGLTEAQLQFLLHNGLPLNR